MIHRHEEYPLFYFMGANYRQSVSSPNRYSLFQSLEFLTKLNEITDGIFTTDDAVNIDTYLRQYYGRYIVKDNLYSYIEEVTKLVDETISDCSYTYNYNEDDHKLQISNLTVNVGSDTIIDNFSYDYLVTDFVSKRIIVLTISKVGSEYAILAHMYDSDEDAMAGINNFELGKFLVIGYGQFTSPDSPLAWYDYPTCSTFIRNFRYDMRSLNHLTITKTELKDSENPNSEKTIENIRTVITNLAYIHKEEWKALKQIAQAYYDKISNGDIFNNYSIIEQRSGTDSVDDERNLKDVSTPNITRSRISTSDRTTTPNTTVESTDINSRVSNVVDDGFHDQSKVNSTTTNTGTTQDNLIADSEDTTMGTETTDRTGTTNREITYGRKVETKGIRDVNQLREYMRLWESARLEWLLAVIHEIVPKFLYMTYEI